MSDRNHLSFIKIREQMAVKKIFGCNEYTRQFGVELSEQQVLALYQSRNEVLKEQERVEFGGGVLEKLIFAFCDSPYIYQDNYIETLDELQRIFYFYKNETMEDIPDDELIQIMKQYFENECQGSLEHLEDSCLERLGREIRVGIAERGE